MFERWFGGQSNERNSTSDSTGGNIGEGQAESRRSEERMDNGEPLYHALLSDEEYQSGAISPGSANEAKAKLTALTNSHPEVVRSCEGKTREQIREMLLPLLSENE